MANNQNLKSFTKGDTRINRRGRPRNIDLARLLSQPIADELVPYGPDGSNITVVEAILRDWAASDEFKKQLAFVQYAFGKVPKNNATEDSDSTIIVNWGKTITSQVVYDSPEDRPSLFDYDDENDLHPPLLNPY
jgi:hypothetical protein